MSPTKPTLAYAMATDDLRHALVSDDSLARLAAVSVRDFLGPEAWNRGIVVTTITAAANARPVAEYTLAMILLSGKDVLGQAARSFDLVVSRPFSTSRRRNHCPEGTRSTSCPMCS